MSLLRVSGRPTRAVLALAAIGVAAFTLVACGQQQGSSGLGALPTPVGVTSTPPAVPDSSGAPTSVPSGPDTAGPANPPPARPHIVYFKVIRKPQCDTAPIQLSWKVTGAAHVAFSDDEPDYYESHGGRAGKRGVFPTTYVETIDFPCGDSTEDTTHEYTINTMGNGTSQKMTIKFTLPAVDPSDSGAPVTD